MPTVAICKACGKKLRIADGVTATKGRCPGCGAVVLLTKTEIASKSAASGTKEDAKPRSKADAEEDVRQAPADVEPRKRRKKRPGRNKAKSGPTIPWWMWGTLAGVVLLFIGIVCAAVIHAGHAAELFAFLIVLAILLPISVVILVVSMFLASVLLGGVDFGQAHVAIPKAAALLFVVTLLQLIPYAGPPLAFFVWFLGLMGLFGLDFVEARTLAVINWGLNSVIRYIVLAAILSHSLHHPAEDERWQMNTPPDKDAAVPMLEASLATRPDSMANNKICALFPTAASPESSWPRRTTYTHSQELSS